MDADYPDHLLAREPAPPFDGEGLFALWHFSEDPSLGRFRPRAPAASPAAPPLVRAVDTRQAPLFWFPRDCPRGCIWPVSATTPDDTERFFGQSAASRVHVTETGWLGRLRDCRLYAYRLPAGAFRRVATDAWSALPRSGRSVQLPGMPIVSLADGSLRHRVSQSRY